jgi:TPR repeat protein
MYDENWEPRLVDFGFAKIHGGPLVSAGHTLPPSDRSVEYSAPECLDSSDYGHKIDVFSYGMILYRIVFDGAPLFPESLPAFNIMNELRSGVRPPIPDETPDILKNIISRCWDTDPMLRPEFADIVKLLLDYEDPLFPGTDQSRYRAYREHIFRSTNLTSETREIFEAKAISADDVASFNAARSGAEAGDAEQMFAVARKFEKGIGVSRDKRQAFHYYLEAARRDHATAKYFVGLCYRDGTGVDANQHEAVRWFTEAAKGPHLAQAAVQLALMLKAGADVNAAEVVALLRRAASPIFRSREAQYHLASILELGIGVTADLSEAARYYELALKGGEQGAGVDLAAMFINGRGVPCDINRGLTILEQLATQKFPMAHYNLGFIYEAGKSVAKDLERSKSHYRKAMELGLDMGYAKLASLLMAEAKVPGTDEDKAAELEREGAELMSQAADMGYAPAQMSYAKLLTEGRGVAPNVRMAKEYLLMAAKSGSALAMVMLADILVDGTGKTKKNITAARRLYTIAARKGNRAAMDKLTTLPPP